MRAVITINKRVLQSIDLFRKIFNKNFNKNYLKYI